MVECLFTINHDNIFIFTGAPPLFCALTSQLITLNRSGNRGQPGSSGTSGKEISPDQLVQGYLSKLEIEIPLRTKEAALRADKTLTGSQTQRPLLVKFLVELCLHELRQNPSRNCVTLVANALINRYDGILMFLHSFTGKHPKIDDMDLFVTNRTHKLPLNLISSIKEVHENVMQRITSESSNPRYTRHKSTFDSWVRSTRSERLKRFGFSACESNLIENDGRFEAITAYGDVIAANLDKTAYFLSHLSSCCKKEVKAEAMKKGLEALAAFRALTPQPEPFPYGVMVSQVAVDPDHEPFDGDDAQPSVAHAGSNTSSDGRQLGASSHRPETQDDSDDEAVELSSDEEDDEGEEEEEEVEGEGVGSGN